MRRTLWTGTSQRIPVVTNKTISSNEPYGVKIPLTTPVTWSPGIPDAGTLLNTISATFPTKYTVEYNILTTVVGNLEAHGTFSFTSSDGNRTTNGPLVVTDANGILNYPEDSPLSTTTTNAPLQFGYQFNTTVLSGSPQQISIQEYSIVVQILVQQITWVVYAIIIIVILVMIILIAYFASRREVAKDPAG